MQIEDVKSEANIEPVVVCGGLADNRSTFAVKHIVRLPLTEESMRPGNPFGLDILHRKGMLDRGIERLQA